MMPWPGVIDEMVATSRRGMPRWMALKMPAFTAPLATSSWPVPTAGTISPPVWNISTTTSSPSSAKYPRSIPMKGPIDPIVGTTPTRTVVGAPRGTTWPPGCARPRPGCPLGPVSPVAMGSGRSAGTRPSGGVVDLNELHHAEVLVVQDVAVQDEAAGEVLEAGTHRHAAQARHVDGIS